MKFTFKSEQYNTTVEMNFEGIQLENIKEMFDQFLRGSGFYLVDEDDMYTKQENSDMSEECVPESDMEVDDDIQEYKRPWVGLSNAEAAAYSNVYSGIRLATMIEALLKERNSDN